MLVTIAYSQKLIIYPSQDKVERTLSQNGLPSLLAIAMFSKFENENFNRSKEYGLQEHYPVPQVRDLLFYIQRNHNHNTIVYTLNRLQDGSIDSERPLNAFWIMYNEASQIKELNLIQTQLVYGYNSWRINNESFLFKMVAYEKQDFILAKGEDGEFRISTILDDEMTIISNIYVYAEEHGVFPQVKFIEFYGLRVDDLFPIYKKVIF